VKNKEDDFVQATVAIVGLGLMGGSLAFALKGKCTRVLGVDHDPRTIDLALEQGAVDDASTSPELLIPQADMIILALPVLEILDFIRHIPTLHPGGAVILDLGSTKAEIVNAMFRLPKAFEPIGGHPMCGKETSGFENADPRMYHEAPFALSPLERTSQNALSLAEMLVRAVGAVPIWLDPETHDAWVAATSHLPFLLASTLVSSVQFEDKPLVGPGFRDVSRLANSDPRMMVDILTTNREQVLKALSSFLAQLEYLKSAIEKGDSNQLMQILEKASQHRDFLVGERGGYESDS
jgi:prephenate dehydrogenase